MAQTVKQLQTQFESWANAHPDQMMKSYQSLLENVAASPAKYKGEPVEFLYQPVFISQDHWEDLGKITRQMMDLIRHVTQVYLENPAFRRHFAFPPLMEQLILKDPGYEEAVPMTRIDLFYNLESGEFKFCEINTDGSSGMTEARELQQIIGDSPGVEALGLVPGQLNQGELFDSWVTAFRSNYDQWCENHHCPAAKEPAVAIVDLMSKEAPSEFVEFQKAFEAAGMPCVIVDARHLTWNEGKLMAGDVVIDAVYRRLVTWELIEHEAQLQPLIQAILEDAVCVIGPVRSQIPHNKRFFAVLHDEEATAFLSQDERDFVRRHVPFTAALEASDPQKWQAWIDQKDLYLIKPDDRYASYGVYAGRDFSTEEWTQKLNTALTQSYLIQAYCHVPQMPMAVVTADQVAFIPFHYLIGCFVYNGAFQGPYIRVGTKSIIGSVVECFTVPAYWIADQV